jgi:hypothetical protein
MPKELTGVEKIIAGLNLLNKYPEMEVGAEHSVLLVSVDRELVSVTDVERLEKLGFDWSNEYECWQKYV